MRFFGLYADKFKPDDLKLWKDYCETLKGQRIEVTIETEKSQRNGEQNKKYWALLESVEDYTGQDKLELHDFFKAKFLKVVFDDGTEDILSTTNLNTAQFAKYYDKVELFIHENGLI